MAPSRMLGLLLSTLTLSSHTTTAFQNTVPRSIPTRVFQSSPPSPRHTLRHAALTPPQNDETTPAPTAPVTSSMPQTRRALLSSLITTATTAAATTLLAGPTPATAAEEGDPATAQTPTTPAAAPTPPADPIPATAAGGEEPLATVQTPPTAPPAPTPPADPTPARAAGEEDFATIQSRAARLASQAKDIQGRDDVTNEARIVAQNSDTRDAYDFDLPVAGRAVPFGELIKQKYNVVAEEGVVVTEKMRRKGVTVKAILVVNMKQDDPIARKNIPELISLAAKFGRENDFAVICSPSDQGYFEPDTSELIRLKLSSEYGYGLNPATILTDKVNLLGTGAHPFWRWMEGTCRTPSGLGRIQGNFEKFLIDGRTGKPVRRYPRQYQPFDIADDIDALVRGKTLPPAGANWKEEWRSADKEAVSDQFRFQKGLNVFDQ